MNKSDAFGQGVEKTICISRQENVKTSVSNDLKRMQQEQQEYELRYHKDVCALPFQQRAPHMALHFCKYSGLVAESHERHDPEVLNGAIADIFINCAAGANIFSFSLSNKIPFADNEGIETFEDLGKIHSDYTKYNSNEPF